MSMDSLHPRRGRAWRWWFCCLLLLATMINYMDRMTLNLLADHINADLGLDKNDYASVEAGFALAFAVGAVIFGFLVDRWNVFWVYPVAVLGWSLAGFATGLAHGFATLLFFRVLLGFAESANWPCALRATQHVLLPGERSVGNGILQSGAALGAILIPLLLLLLYDQGEPATWRRPFFIVGAVGAGWVVLWWSSVRAADLALPPPEVSDARLPALPPALFARRYGVLVVLVVALNMTWHFLRAWGPLYLKESRGFSDGATFWFSSAYYTSTDVGALSAGFLTLLVIRGGASVHAGRRQVFLGYAALTALCAFVPFIATPWALVATLLVVGFGALGVFSNYYSFSQDLTVRHQGKVTGTLGCLCWIAMAGWQKCIGWLVTATGSYTIPFIISGVAPLIGFAALLLWWGEADEAVPVPAGAAPVGDPGIRAPASVRPASHPG